MGYVFSVCSVCGREIPPGEKGYFALNEKTDRFDLQCKFCSKIAPLIA